MKVRGTGAGPRPEQGAAHGTGHLFKVVSGTGETWGDRLSGVLWSRLPERAGMAGQKEGFQLKN